MHFVQVVAIHGETLRSSPTNEIEPFLVTHFWSCRNRNMWTWSGRNKTYNFLLLSTYVTPANWLTLGANDGSKVAPISWTEGRLVGGDVVVETVVQGALLPHTLHPRGRQGGEISSKEIRLWGDLGETEGQLATDDGTLAQRPPVPADHAPF